MTSSNSRCATFTNEADGYVYDRSLYNSFLTLVLDTFHQRVLLASSSRLKVQLSAMAIIFLLLLGLQMLSTIALLEKANLGPAEIEYVAFYFHKYRIKFYLILVSSKLTAPVSI